MGGRESDLEEIHLGTGMKFLYDSWLYNNYGGMLYFVCRVEPIHMSDDTVGNVPEQSRDS